MKKVIQFVTEAKEELSKVTWPDRDEVSRFTVIVIITAIVVSLFLWMVDTGLMFLIQSAMD